MRVADKREGESIPSFGKERKRASDNKRGAGSGRRRTVTGKEKDRGREGEEVGVGEEGRIITFSFCIIFFF